MDLYWADKPAGATTHTSLNDKQTSALKDTSDGFAESLASRLNTKLFVAHRLDRDTTGAMVFARTPEMAETLRQAFETRTVKKRYLFLTDRASKQTEFTAESLIERRQGQYVSESRGTVNARTRFRLLESSHGLNLWEALPETGKAHQIRLHAEDHGIPILGDDDHGGSDFATLALHSARLEITINGVTHLHESPAPRWFLRRELARSSQLLRWLVSVDRRERLQRSWGAREETLRWIHTEGDPLRLEQLGDVLSISWFRDREPGDSEWQAIRSLVHELGFEKWYLQIRGNRGRAPGGETIFTGDAAFAPRWQALENGLNFEFRTDSGLSPGLFLDQRRNRDWVRQNVKGERVLNLFCYTGGFSVAAAAGGATQTVSVDVSKAFLDWAKRNFELNGLTTEGHEFRAMDSREYLAWAKKKQLAFDLVICDPPSFSRSKSGLFRIDDDFENLLHSLLAVVRPGGRCLFALNYEAWDESTLEKRAKEALRSSGLKGQLLPTPPPDWDFELPGQTRNMKSFFVLREK